MLINVDLNRDGTITQMDDSLLEKQEGTDTNLDPDGSLHDTRVWTKYLLDGKVVHESAHTTIHKVLPEMKPILAKLIG